MVAARWDTSFEINEQISLDFQKAAGTVKNVTLVNGLVICCYIASQITQGFAVLNSKRRQNGSELFSRLIMLSNKRNR